MEERRKTQTAGEYRHNVTMENRNKMQVSGVSDVESFDEQTIILYTNMGTMTIRGIDFRINKLNVESGDIAIEGEIDSIAYSGNEGREKGGNFFSRMFK